MKKSFLILAMLLLCVASFALSDMVSLNYADGSRTIPIEDVERIYYSATTDSLDIQLADTNYYYKADTDLQITFLDSIEGQHKREREALIAIYHALDGDNWINNKNWCSEMPLDEWAGIDTENGFVKRFQLAHKNLVGSLPKEVSHLLYLEILNITGNQIDYIPNEIIYLTHLQSLRLPRIRKIPENLLSMSGISELSLDLRNCSDWNDTLDFSAMTNLRGLELSADSIPFPIGLQALSKLYSLYINGCIGEFPDLSQSINLRSLKFQNCSVNGSIPSWIGNLKNLEAINMNKIGLTGEIPKEMFLLQKLNSLSVEENSLSGTLPKEMADYFLSENLIRTGLAQMGYNKLKGSISIEIEKHPNWCNVWQNIVLNNQFNLKDIYLPGPQFKGIDIDGDSIYSEDVYPKNKYTILWSIASNMAWGNFLNWNASVMVQFYEKYKNYGIDILYAADEWNTIEEIEALREEYNIQFRCFNTNRITENRLIINQNRQCKFLQYYLTPEEILGNSVMVVDSIGNTVFMSEIDGYETELDQFLYRNLCKDSIDYYVSSDYSQHMLIDTLQMATIGKGIDIVLMGDAYSDRQIADSTYHKDLQYLYENLFTEEPYKSYKEMFNVFTVNVVSPTEGYEHGSTALGGFFGYETEVGGNDGAVIEYASLAVEYEKLDNAIVIVAMNSDKYAGTCYMYYPSDTTITFGNGLSISYFPKGGDAETFAQLLHHEALGHGFAKLADEYAYEEYGAVPESTVALHQEQQTNWGWWKNIDFTNDSSEIRWSRLLLDERYQYDGLGAFEGGLTYWTGVWRPTENSIMRYNIGGFNAPSREAIYYRIHKLAYGDEWEYDYEKFVEWDAKNRKTAESPLLMPSRDKMENFTPTHPPVIKQMSWREAVEQKAQQKVKAMPEERNSTSATTQQGAKIIYTTRK